MTTKPNTAKKTRTKTSSKAKESEARRKKPDAAHIQYVQPAQQNSRGLGLILVRLIILLGAIVGFAALLKYGIEYVFGWEFDNEEWWTLFGIGAGLGILWNIIKGISE